MGFAPTPMSVRTNLDHKYEHVVVVRADGIEIVPVVRGVSKGFPFTEAQSTGPEKTAIVILRPGVKLESRVVMTSHPYP